MLATGTNMTLQKHLTLIGILLFPGIISANSDLFASANELWTNDNHEAAVVEYHELAESGHSGAQFRLGHAYENGIGVTQKHRLANAMRWYRAAAEQGHSEAQNRLGDLYFNGDWKGDIRQDLQVSMQWHMHAAEQGNLNSQFKLGSLLCWHGQQVEGYAWLWLANTEGMGNAGNELRRICNKITADQIETAKQLADSFRSSITANTR
jgi:TPR repeat protein